MTVWTSVLWKMDLHMAKNWPEFARNGRVTVIYESVLFGNKTWWQIANFTNTSGLFFVNYMNIFHKTEVQTVILRCLVSLNLNWIKSYNIILVKKNFFNAWKCIISGLFRRSEFWDLRRKSAVIFSKWLFWQNSLMISWTT